MGELHAMKLVEEAVREFLGNHKLWFSINFDMRVLVSF